VKELVLFAMSQQLKVRYWTEGHERQCDTLEQDRKVKLGDTRAWLQLLE